MADTTKPPRDYKTPEQPIEAAQVPDAMLTIQTVAAITGLSMSSIREKARAGLFPAPRRFPHFRMVRWRAGDVTDWLKQVQEAAANQIKQQP